MVGVATGLQVLVAGGAAVGDRVDVVELQPVTVPAVGAFLAGEVGRVAQVQGGSQGYRDVPPQPGELADLEAVVNRDVQEGVLGKLLGQVDRYRTASRM
ncbi:MAG TPA: hypothetical protein VFZ97_20265 [Acidimicrobiales bacterium]